MLVARQRVITVATAGTRVPVFATGTANPAAVVGSITFQPCAVTTSVFIGDANVSSSVFGMKLLAASGPVTLELGSNALDLATLYIDATTSGDKVSVLYFEKVGR